MKIGHGGTLDPLATGVLIAGIGIGTKSLQDFLKCTKTYETILLFGASTDTYDRVGKVLRKAPYEHITRELVEEKMEAFKGTFLQLPPIFSALKMDGKPLYEYAREGKPIPREIERRPVEVVELELLEWMEGGTHEHKAPTEEGSEAEINVAKQVWAQAGFEDVADAESGSMAEKEAAAQKEFESRKRKLSEDQDELVQEKPAKYVKTDSPEYTKAVMSGGLSDAEPESVPTSSVEIKTDATPATTTITPTPPSPTSKGPPAARIRMTVTSGFYVRSFCHDLGTAVGSAGLMAELIRSRQGDFSFEAGNVLEYSDLKRGEEVWGPQVNRMTDEWWAKKAAPARSNAPEKTQSSESAAKADVEEPTKVEDPKPEAAEPVKAEESTKNAAEEAKVEQAPKEERVEGPKVPAEEAMPDVAADAAPKSS